MSPIVLEIVKIDLISESPVKIQYRIRFHLMIAILFQPSKTTFVDQIQSQTHQSLLYHTH